MSDDSAQDGDEIEARHESQVDGGSHASAKESQPKQSKSEVPNSASRRTSQAKYVAAKNKHSWFAIPAPLKRLFDHFPLITYAENELPLRAFRQRAEHTLYIFTHEKHAPTRRPSFNPSCLKWQTYLNMRHIPFTTRPSNNHASPSGSLPFLQTQSEEDSVSNIVPSNSLKRWVKQQSPDSTKEPNDVRSEVYASLLENRIQKAWLYQLYLHPANEAVVRRLYVDSASSNPLVQMTLLSQLRSAAELEIVKASTNSGSAHRIDEADIMRDAEEAFEALSSLLGDATWFFSRNPCQQSKNAGAPGLFDASVFAYTHLILDGSDQENSHPVIEWKANGLKSTLKRHDNLVQHSENISNMYY